MFMHKYLASLVVLAAAGFAAPLRGEDLAPLFVLQISEAALNRLNQKSIEQESAVNNVFMGARIVGTAKTTGNSQVCLVDGDSGPTIKVLFTGTTVSRTAGYQTPVVIYSRAQTDFTVERSIAMEHLEDATAHTTRFRAKTSVTTENITTSRRRLVGKIVLRKAWQAVAASEGEARAMAQQDAKQQIVAAFDEALKSGIEQLKTQLSLRDLVAATLPVDAAPAYRAVTKGGYLSMAVFAHEPESKVTLLSLPTLTIKEQPFQLWLHKSVADDKLVVAKNDAVIVRNWLAFPTFLSSAAAAKPPSGPQWITVGDWYLVQLAEMGK